MIRPSLTLIVSGLFLAYIGNSLWTIYGVFFPVPCVAQKQLCLTSFLVTKPRLQMSVYTSTKEKMTSEKNMKLVWQLEDFVVAEQQERDLNVTLPLKTRKNGTLYIHSLVYPRDERNPFTSRYMNHASSRLTYYTYPASEAFNLMGSTTSDSSNATKTKSRKVGDVITAHWHSKVKINVMEDDIAFDRHAIPGEVYKYLKVSPDGQYLPVVKFDELAYRIKDLLLIKESSKEMPLKLIYEPVSVGKIRMWASIEESFKLMKSLGFTDKDCDEMKGIFSDTNFYFLMMTFTVAAFHLLFDFLAFKNDISFWKNRETMVGLSTRMVLFRCVSTIVVFFYLLDQDTSLLVVVPTGIGALIEAWKVKKALKLSVTLSGFIPKLKFGEVSKREKETAEFDTQAMKYISYLLYPLCICGAAYSLLYVPHKSWYSWCIQSLVNGVYAFGFLFMLPQLFVNYKLKSVAHLPWRAFMYKAFNTFIDDIFAFIITMPTAHRLACFRDDAVFLVYLYQRWLYPVDKTRVNEFGQSFDEIANEDDKKKEKLMKVVQEILGDKKLEDLTDSDDESKKTK